MSDLEKRITDIQINHLFIGEENGFSIWMHWIPTSSPFCGDVTWYLVRPKLLTTFIGVSPNTDTSLKRIPWTSKTHAGYVCALFFGPYIIHIYIYAFIIMSIFSLYLFFCTRHLVHHLSCLCNSTLRLHQMLWHELLHALMENCRI